MIEFIRGVRTPLSTTARTYIRVPVRVTVSRKSHASGRLGLGAGPGPGSIAPSVAGRGVSVGTWWRDAGRGDHGATASGCPGGPAAACCSARRILGTVNLAHLLGSRYSPALDCVILSATGLVGLAGIVAYRGGWHRLENRKLESRIGISLGIAGIVAFGMIWLAARIAPKTPS